MKKHWITMDCGTTNTRVFLWNSEGTLLDQRRENVGVRNTAIDGHNGALTQGVARCIKELLHQHELPAKQCYFIASGMISSNVGLVEIPHLLAPAGKSELAAGMVPHHLPAICTEPIWFIPGIKNHQKPVDIMGLETMDIMRGEEVECIAMLEWEHSLVSGKRSIFVLPGSHSKFIPIDDRGRICGCVTMLTGEILECITKHTIIADAVGKQFVNEGEYNREMVFEGFRAARQLGMARVAFLPRILAQFTSYGKPDIANYLLGCVLSEDGLALKNSQILQAQTNTPLVIAGKEPLQSALIDLLGQDGYEQIHCFEAPNNVPLSGWGALAIAKENPALIEGAD